MNNAEKTFWEVLVQVLIHPGGGRVKDKSLHIRTLQLLFGPSLPLILSTDGPPVGS